MTLDLAMLLVHLAAEFQRRAFLQLPAGTPVARFLVRSATQTGSTIHQLREDLRQLELECALMLTTPVGKELNPRARIPGVLEMWDFVKKVPRTALTEPVVSAILTGTTPPPWCPVTRETYALACKASGGGSVLRALCVSLVGWYARTDPQGPVRADVQAALDGMLAEVRKREGSFEPLQQALESGLDWMQTHMAELVQLLRAPPTTLADLDPEELAMRHVTPGKVN